MSRVTLVVVGCLAVVLLVASCGEDGSTPVVEVPATTTTTTTTADPYEEYLDNAPKGEPVLSREDAQIRALLGCEMSFAPGTIDAVLQRAYKELCEAQS